MSREQQEVLRFAPSPNGRLHLGHAFSALTGERLARARGARYLLRIEDIDRGRCRPDLERELIGDLAWLGIEWDGEIRRQSEHFGDYERALQRLRAQNLVYPCFATRGEILDAIAETGIGLERWPRDPDGAPVYPGLYRGLPARQLKALLLEERSFAWRLDMAKAKAEAERIAGGPICFAEEGQGPAGETGEQTIKPELFGDVVLARKDVPTSYHLAVTVDDALQGVTLVTRGRDLFPATHVHRLLQVLLGLPAPRYHHHGLIRDAEGRKLSKSMTSKSLRDYRDEGMGPDDIKRLIGLPPEPAAASGRI
ncbi:MAG: tRNA glutamyl-Q(34) synthetase GluQRS [Parvibaculaceae bacterium]|nr:tRNA glutamyl-Q(34) synthetase GluQRS [Parvibaculaceae bacterium]